MKDRWAFRPALTEPQRGLATLPTSLSKILFGSLKRRSPRDAQFGTQCGRRALHDVRTNTI